MIMGIYFSVRKCFEGLVLFVSLNKLTTIKLINMNKKTSPYLRLNLILFIICSLLFLNFSSCRKAYNNANEKLPTNWRERFFALPADAPDVLQRIADKIKEEDKQTGFLENFVKENGFIRWEYADIQPARQRNNTMAIETNNVVVVLLPTVPLNEEIVKSIIASKVDINDVLLKLYQDKKYAAYGFDLSVNRDKPNANDVVQRIMAFHKEIFNDTYFKVTDKRLYDKQENGVVRPESFYVTAIYYGSPAEGECWELQHLGWRFNFWRLLE